MKNIIKNLLLIIAVVALVCSFASCNLLTGGSNQNNDNDFDDGSNTENGSNNNNTNNKDQTYIESCDQLNVFANQKYSVVDLTIKTVNGDVTLESVFSIKSNNEIEYHIEELAKFEISENGTVIIPENYIEVTEGTAVISEDKNTVNLDGDFIVVNFYTELVGNFHFSYDNFKNFVLDGNNVKFDVVDPSDFFGGNVDLRNVSVNVVYDDAGLSSINVDGKLNGASVTYSYEFGEVTQ